MAAVFFITKIKYKFFYWMVTFSKGLGYRCTVVAHQTHQKWPGNTLKFNFNILNMAEYSHVQVHSHVIGLVTRTCLKKLLNLLIYTRFLMVFYNNFLIIGIILSYISNFVCYLFVECPISANIIFSWNDSHVRNGCHSAWRYRTSSPGSVAALRTDLSWRMLLKIE